MRCFVDRLESTPFTFVTQEPSLLLLVLWPGLDSTSPADDGCKNNSHQSPPTAIVSAILFNDQQEQFFYTTHRG